MIASLTRKPQFSYYTAEEQSSSVRVWFGGERCKKTHTVPATPSMPRKLKPVFLGARYVASDGCRTGGDSTRYVTGLRDQLGPSTHQVPGHHGIILSSTDNSRQLQYLFSHALLCFILYFIHPPIKVDNGCG